MNVIRKSMALGCATLAVAAGYGIGAASTTSAVADAPRSSVTFDTGERCTTDRCTSTNHTFTEPTKREARTIDRRARQIGKTCPGPISYMGVAPFAVTSVGDRGLVIAVGTGVSERKHLFRCYPASR